MGHTFDRVSHCTGSRHLAVALVGLNVCCEYTNECENQSFAHYKIGVYRKIGEVCLVFDSFVLSIIKVKSAKVQWVAIGRAFALYYIQKEKQWCVTIGNLAKIVHSTH